MPLPVTEKQLEKAIAEMAQFFGWMVFHARPASTGKGWRTPVSYDGKGFPDLTLVGPRVVFAEIKAKGGKLSPEQILWREQIARAAGGEWHLWTPAEWDSGEVSLVLTSKKDPKRQPGGAA